jgi:cell division protein FtsQ
MDGTKMIRKITHIVIWLVLGAWFTVILGFVSGSNERVLCKQIVVNITDSSEVRFVTGPSVRERILGAGMDLQGYPVEGIRTRELEKQLEQDPYVENAEVYVDVEGSLYVDVVQRKPLLRVMPDGKEGYYIDQYGLILPLSANYSPMVLLVTGDLSFAETLDDKGMRRADLSADEELEMLLGFAGKVAGHPFWNRQIVQVYRGRDGMYELIPRVGAHQIEFGTLEDYGTKLRNLKLLYEQGLSQYGWNTYDKIDLKYSNQIICTKR